MGKRGEKKEEGKRKRKERICEGERKKSRT